MVAAKWAGASFDFSHWAGRTFWGSHNTTLATNETIFSVVTRFANIMASLPIKLHENYDLINSPSSDVLLYSPNPNLSSFDFIRNMETMRNEKGNAYAVIERDIRGQPARLTPLDAMYVEPMLARETNELWYKVIGEKATYYFHNMDMLHVKHIMGSGSLKGISPIDVLKNTADYDKAVREFSLKEMQGAFNSFVLKYGANVDDGKRKRVVEDFRRFYAENGGVLFQEPGVEIDPIQRKYVAADTFTSERITRSRVANVFNMPVTLLNDTEGQSFSSNEELMRSFVQLTLIPIVRQYEQEFNRKLLTPADRQRGQYFKINVGGLLRGDSKARQAFYHGALRDGWMTRNEVRRWEDLPPKEGPADELWISGDMYPLDMDPRERREKVSERETTKEE
ncbi:phage portal protein [Bacillus sp. A301a_S52]|nr:phage portal protein [Bacillus sp. A301a_S52]